jgi:hypothetical protein
LVPAAFLTCFALLFNSTFADWLCSSFDLGWRLPTAPQIPTACRLCPLAIALSKLRWWHRWLQVTPAGVVRTCKTLITGFSERPVKQHIPLAVGHTILFLVFLSLH